MASGIINKEPKPSVEFTTESRVVTLNWTSTANPYANGVEDVSKSGWTPVSIGFSVDQTGATNVAPYRFFLSGNNINYGFRMFEKTPSSVTQNTVQFVITYMRFLQDS